MNTATKVLSYNICHSRRATGGLTYLSQPSRTEELIEYIKSTKADIICLQEVHEDSLSEFNKIFSKIYECYETRHSSRQGCCFLVTLVRKDFVHKAQFINHFSFSFHNKFKDQDEMVRCINVVQLGDLTVVNVHSPMAKDLRFKVNKVLLEKFGQSKNTVVIMGDMNTFVDMNGKEQIQELVDAGFSHSCLDKKTTFQPCPYDRVPEGAEPCVLDHVFFLNGDIDVCQDLPIPILKNKPSSDVKDRWLSDHLPTIFLIKNIING